MADLGNDHKGDNEWGVLVNGRMYVSKFTCVGNHDVTALKCYVKQKGAATPKMRFFIYADAGDGSAGVMLGKTVEWSLTGGWDDWKDLALDGADVAVTNGTIYHLGFMFDDDHNIYWDASGTGNKLAFSAIVWYPNFEDPFTGNPVADRLISVYAIFAVAGVASRRLLVGVGL